MVSLGPSLAYDWSISETSSTNHIQACWIYLAYVFLSSDLEWGCFSIFCTIVLPSTDPISLLNSTPASTVKSNHCGMEYNYAHTQSCINLHPPKSRHVKACKASMPGTEQVDINTIYHWQTYIFIQIYIHLYTCTQTYTYIA